MQTESIDRFRGWALTALYASMSVLCLMLVLAAFQFWPAIKDGATEVLFLAATGAATSVLSAISSFRFFSALRREERPKLHLTPFLLMALTLFAAANLFSGF